MDKIRNSLEDRAIKKSGIEATLDSTTKTILGRIEPQIKESKDAVSSFRELAYDKLPGLEGRIERHGRQQDYIRFVLPYKDKGSKRRR